VYYFSGCRNRKLIAICNVSYYIDHSVYRYTYHNDNNTIMDIFKYNWGKSIPYQKPYRTAAGAAFRPSVLVIEKPE